ncbi:hypothetical protein FHU35_13140 [Saccharopolyspora dendranthemae]|uniref:Uncharacterized protein n=1 Tax=Saccharopolyspora dendranthemae TaxID=1181886 RepID=A0A561U527_9PSEU|nr:hypothetical protein FHU35_13140 [Saccharopolyspora dendranthemae]
MKPFLTFAKWVNEYAIDTLIEHGLDPEVGSWAIRTAAHRYYRIFVAFAVPYFATIALHATASVSDVPQFERLFISTAPLPSLAFFYLSWIWHRPLFRSNPISLLEDLLSMTVNLTIFEGGQGDATVPADGHKWPGYALISARIRETKQKLEAISWRFTKKVARLAGNTTRERTDPRWSRTSRAVLYAADEPFNRRRRNLAYKAISRHIAQLYTGKLYDPTPRVHGMPNLPAPRPPRLKSRIQTVLRAQTTYTIAATLIAATIGPLLTTLLRR